MFRFRSLLALLVMNLVCSVLMGAESDQHLQSDPARAAYQRSSFLHGYIHGYEDGFHAADVDLQMGRGAQALRKNKQFRHPKSSYRYEYGDERRFVRGYVSGFNVGYVDGVNGKAFRATYETQSLAQAIAVVGPEPAQPSRYRALDEGLFQGYGDGVPRGTADARADRRFELGDPECDALKAGKSANSVEYCHGYSGGFRLGYSDGYRSLRTPSEGDQTARR